MLFPSRQIAGKIPGMIHSPTKPTRISLHRRDAWGKRGWGKTWRSREGLGRKEDSSPGPPHTYMKNRQMEFAPLTCWPPVCWQLEKWAPKIPIPQGYTEWSTGVKQEVLRCLFFLNNKEINLCSHLKCRWTPVRMYTHRRVDTYVQGAHTVTEAGGQKV